MMSVWSLSQGCQDPMIDDDIHHYKEEMSSQGSAKMSAIQL